MNIKKHIPNAITCGNLLCGCLAVIKIFEGDLVWAAYLVGIAVVLDFFDGFTARVLKVASPIGKDLDSLADMVTFGLVPGFMMFKLLFTAYVVHIAQTSGAMDTAAVGLENRTVPIQYLALLIPIFSAIRLAKFNNDTRQTESFIGVPTPANAIFICSIPLSAALLPNLNVYVLSFIAVLMSFLLVAPIPLFALKFKNFGWKGNEIRYIFLVLCALCLILFQFLGLAIAIVLYVAMSVLNNLFFKPKAS